MSAPVVVQQFPLEKEYAKKTGVTPEDVGRLRAWLSTQPHLPETCSLRSSEVSKQVLDLHYTVKTLFDNFFKNRVVDQKALALSQEEEGTWPGLAIVFDLNLFTMQHLAKLDLQAIQQFLYYLQEAMLVEVTGIHFINAPAFIDKLMMLIKPFMKKALIDCLHIHQVGATTLEKHMPIAALPKDAGGEFDSIAKISDDLKERIKLNKEFFARETKKRVADSSGGGGGGRGSRSGRHRGQLLAACINR
ncbi:hypothetical protein MSG28_006003 [Choristoneura fumiferana]|uniref:Uncharacterized protein n=1 Tax=Choristoneura fumiferana TaxID=7141 RepID=A0ACC0L1Z5_CHOFU|nr:hypothetical protein MSG28_006003 [Choristoneura fumiferana]